MLHSLSSARLCSACSKLPSRDGPERPVAMSPGVFVRTFFGSHIAPRLLACFPTSMACSKGGMFGARKRTPARACPHERFQVWCRLPPDDYGVCSSSEALGIRAFIFWDVGSGLLQKPGCGGAWRKTRIAFARNHRCRRTFLPSRLQLRLLQRSLSTRSFTWLHR